MNNNRQMSELILSTKGSAQAQKMITQLASGQKVDLGQVKCLCDKDKEFLLQQILSDSLSINASMFGFAPDAINNNPNLVATLLNSMSLNLSTLLPRLAKGFYYSGLNAIFSSNDEVSVSPTTLITLLGRISNQDWNVNSDSVTFDDAGNITVGADVFTQYDLPDYAISNQYLGHFISVNTYNTNRGLTTLNFTNADGYNVAFKKDGTYDTAYIFIPMRGKGSSLTQIISKNPASVVPVLKATIDSSNVDSGSKFVLFDLATGMKETTIKGVNASLTVQPVTVTPAVLAHLTVALVSGDFGQFFEHLKHSFGSGR